MGDSSQQQSTQSNTQPWAPAQPEVQGLINGVQGLIPGATSLTPGQSSAIDALSKAGAAGNPYAGTTQTALDYMLHGGGATSEIPAVQQNLTDYKTNMGQYLDPNYSTINSPAVQAALQTIRDDVSSNVNGTFAASGRTGSGMNVQTLGRGIAQGEAPVILNQANQDTATRIGAANGVYNAGNTTAGTVAGMNQNAVANENTGINNTGTVLNNSVWGPETELAAEELRSKIPAQNLGLLANIGIPLAQLGTQGNSVTNTENNPSLLSDISQGAGIAKNLFSGGAGSTIAGMGSSAAGGLSGLMALLAL